MTVGQGSGGASHRRRRSVESAIRQAMTSDGLTLHYQPQVSLHTGRFVGVEALARCVSSPLGPLNPGEFIPAVELSALIHDLGRWTITEALRDAATWHAPASDVEAPTVAINVSLHQLLNQSFPTSVTEALEESGVDPQRVTLEITETAFVDHLDPVITALRDLHRRGLRLSIDDFGTGHASLTYLARFPVDEVKIDQTFVSGLETDRASAVIVESVIAMAHALGMTVVAEGVETLPQLEHLLEVGCDLAQGYLFARPAAEHIVGPTLATSVPWPVELAGRRTKRHVTPAPVTVDPSRRYRLLIDVARDITASRDLDTVMTSTFEALRRLLPFTGGSIQLIDGAELFLAATDPPATPEALGARIPVGAGVGGRIALTGEPRYIADIAADVDVPEARRQQAVSGGVRSYFGAPLISEGQIIGLLQVDSVAVDAFSVEDQTLVLAFIPIVAAAVSSARLRGRVSGTVPIPQRQPT